ncbi:MAG: hypothetical protein LBJ67_12525 [Planctomycetaceae bacterium]|nr:hypothetical protein [Planctomycetaceae bacterium]
MTFQLPASAEQYRSVFLMEVTPKLAAEWLGKNYLNRKLDSVIVNRYSRQILHGGWRRTHQGIAFDRNGVLLDGQHRLAAVCLSNVPVKMLVFVNQSFNNHEVIDGGKPRTNLDVIQLELQDSRITTKHLLTLRAMYGGRLAVRPNLSSKEINDAYKYHNESIQFAVNQMELTYLPRIDDPTVRGVIARAFYYVQKSQLQIFCEGLCMPYKTLNVITDLRNWLITLNDQRQATRREIYKRMEYTLLAFVLKKETVSIPFMTRELFPLK